MPGDGPFRRSGGRYEEAWLLRHCVSQPFFAARLRSACDIECPPMRPPLRDDSVFIALPRPEPDFLPPPVAAPFSYLLHNSRELLAG